MKKATHISLLYNFNVFRDFVWKYILTIRLKGYFDMPVCMDIFICKLKIIIYLPFRLYRINEIVVDDFDRAVESYFTRLIGVFLLHH